MKFEWWRSVDGSESSFIDFGHIEVDENADAETIVAAAIASAGMKREEFGRAIDERNFCDAIFANEVADFHRYISVEKE